MRRHPGHRLAAVLISVEGAPRKSKPSAVPVARIAQGRLAAGTAL